MDLTREALEFLDEQTLRTVKPIEAHGQLISPIKTYVVHQPTASIFTVRNLSGIVDYLSAADTDGKKFVQVVSPTYVKVFSDTNADRQRDFWIDADAIIPEFKEGKNYDIESMIIKLQAGFIPNEDTAMLLDILANVTDESIKTISDNGVVQQVSVREGVASEKLIDLKPRVSLIPFRTFVEVDQPASDFIFRMGKGHYGPEVAFHEADGGYWKIQAVQNIKDYFAEQIADKALDNVHVIG